MAKTLIDLWEQELSKLDSRRCADVSRQIIETGDARIVALETKNRILLKACEVANFELAALTPFPDRASFDNSAEMWPGMSNPADRECVRIAFEAVRVALGKNKAGG